jgi:lipoprotein-releasing system ATP-binding protein
MNKIIVTKNLSKSYFQGRIKIEAVKDVNLTIEKGECVAIIGPSGAGKSTLLHMIGSLDTPTHGSVLFENVNVYKLNDYGRSKLRNTKIGFVFQFYNLLAEFTVLENVIMPALIKKEPCAAKRDISKKAGDILGRMGLGHRLNHRPAELSGGEAQRVAIARALVNEPDLILCDEPTGNLDSSMSAEIYGIIYTISKERNMTVVIVTHHDYKYNRFDKAYCMRDGGLSKLEE